MYSEKNTSKEPKQRTSKLTTDMSLSLLPLSLPLPLSSRAVLAQLVSHGLLSLQPRPHPLLQGVLRPPLPGRLCLRVMPRRTNSNKWKRHSSVTRDWINILAQIGGGRWDEGKSGTPTLFLRCKILWCKCIYVLVTMVVECMIVQRTTEATLHRCLLFIRDPTDAILPSNTPFLVFICQSMFVCKQTYVNFFCVFCFVCF